MEHLPHTIAWFPARAKVAGRRLAPPTLGHWRLLESCASPFAYGGVATRADTALALAILSRPWRRARRMLASPWRRALALAVLPRPGAWLDLQAWLDAAWASPERYRDDAARPKSEAAAPGTPVSVRLAAAAVRDRLAEACVEKVSSVWDIRITELLMLRAAFDENAGAEYESPEDAAVSAAAEHPPVLGAPVVEVGGLVGVAPAPGGNRDGDDDEKSRDGDGSGDFGMGNRPLV